MNTIPAKAVPRGESPPSNATGTGTSIALMSPSSATSLRRPGDRDHDADRGDPRRQAKRGERRHEPVERRGCQQSGVAAGDPGRDGGESRVELTVPVPGDEAYDDEEDRREGAERDALDGPDPAAVDREHEEEDDAEHRHEPARPRQRPRTEQVAEVDGRTRRLPRARRRRRRGRALKPRRGSRGRRAAPGGSVARVGAGVGTGGVSAGRGASVFGVVTLSLMSAKPPPAGAGSSPRPRRCDRGSSRSWSVLSLRPKLDDEVAVERLGDPKQRVDAGRLAALEARDRGLRRPGDVGELLLREAGLRAALGDPIGDLGEEPAVLGACNWRLSALGAPRVCASGLDISCLL